MSTATAFDFDLISKEEFDARLSERGVEIPAARMRTWQTRGLMPHSFRGGLAYYAQGSVAQALEAERLFGVKNDESFVGWSLWWQGFEVADQYWRESFEHSRSLDAGLAHRMTGVFAALAPSNGLRVEQVVWRLHEALEQGRSQDAPAAHPTLAKLSAMRADEGRRIASSENDAIEAFATMMRMISGAPKPNVSPLIFKADNRHVIFEARDEVRGVLEAAAALHDATKLLVPGRARRLVPAKYLSEKASKAAKAELVLRWMQAKLEQPSPLAPDAIIDMRADAFATLAAAQTLRAAIDRSPKLARVASLKRLREATRNRPGLDSLSDAFASAV